MANQGLFKLSYDDSARAHRSSRTVTCVCADARTGNSVLFLDNGVCLIFTHELAHGAEPSCFKFGARSSGDSSEFTPIESTISTCASLDGFDVVVSQQNSGTLHCLPLGDCDGSQAFVPALSFGRMQGDISRLACAPEAEVLAAADTQGALALFSTSDAARLDFKPDCSRTLVTALYAQPGLLLSGDAGGEVRVWNISEASLVPILTLSTPGRITAALVTEGSTLHSNAPKSRQLVAGTQQGDIFVWNVDMGNISEPWEPQNAEVLEVGMLSLSNTAITHLQGIPAGVAVCCECTDSALSRVCCLDLSEAKVPAVISNETPARVCHMLASCVAGPGSFKSAVTNFSHERKGANDLTLILWTQNRSKGISIMPLPVPAIQGAHAQQQHSTDLNEVPVGAAIAHRDGYCQPDREQTLDAGRFAPSSPPAGGYTYPHKSQDPSVSKSALHTGLEEVVEGFKREVTGAVSMEGYDVEPEELPSSGFSLRALQPAGIVTVPPAVETSSMAPVAGGATIGDRDMCKSQGHRDIAELDKDGVQQENSFCLRSQVLSQKTVRSSLDSLRAGRVTDSAEVEKRQLADLLGVDLCDSQHQDGKGNGLHLAPSGGDHLNTDRGTSDDPAATGCLNARDTAEAVEGRQLRQDPRQDASPYYDMPSSSQPGAMEACAPAQQPGSGESSGQQLSAPMSGVECKAPQSSSGQLQEVMATGRADASLDALRAVREQLEAMCFDDGEGDDDFVDGAGDVPDHSKRSISSGNVDNVPMAVTGGHEPDSSHMTQSCAEAGASSSLQLNKHTESPSCSVDNAQSNSFPEAASQGDKLYEMVPAEKSALQMQFEALEVGQERSHGWGLHGSSPPIGQLQNDVLYSDVAAASTVDSVDPRLGAPEDLHTAPDSPDSLRSSSVFVAGSLKASQYAASSSRQGIKQHAADRIDPAMHLQHASGSQGGIASSSETFSLSQLAIAQQGGTAQDVTEPTDERHSGGGISWALQVGAEQPFSRTSRSPSQRQVSGSICGRQSGHVAAASIHDRKRVPGTTERQLDVVETALQPVVQRPSTAALLRRLTRKKPTVRQILGKAPEANSHGLLSWRQDHLSDSLARDSTPPPAKSQQPRKIGRSPAPRANARGSYGSGPNAHPSTPQTAHAAPCNATPPSSTSRIPSLTKSGSYSHRASAPQAAANAVCSTPPPALGRILVPANPKLLQSSKTFSGSKSMSECNNKPGHQTSRRGKTRSPSPYHRGVKDDSVMMSQAVGRKAPRRVPLEDRLNSSMSSKYQPSVALQDAAGSGLHDTREALKGVENRHPAFSSSRASHQPQRKRSCGAHVRRSSGRGVTVNTVHAPDSRNNACADSMTQSAPHHAANAQPARQREPMFEAAGYSSDSVQLQHAGRSVVAEGAVLQESNVSDRPPGSLARWRVERSAGELAQSQFEALAMYNRPGREGEHEEDRGGRSSMRHDNKTVSMNHAMLPEVGHGNGLMGLLAQENSRSRHDPGDLQADSNVDSAGDVHPLAYPRPGGMTQLLASRIASTAAEAPPVLSENSDALVSARRTASTIASNVPNKSTLYVAVPAVPPALAAARAAAAAAVANGDTPGGCSIAAGAAAGSALENLRKQALKRAGKGPRPVQRSLARSIVPPPLMEDLWKWEEQVVQEAPMRALPPPQPQSIPQVMAEVLQLHRCC